MQGHGEAGHGCPSAQFGLDESDARLKARLAQIQHKVVVLSGKGGVGKSTVAVNLAVALAERGLRGGPARHRSSWAERAEDASP